MRACHRCICSLPPNALGDHSDCHKSEWAVLDVGDPIRALELLGLGPYHTVLGFALSRQGEPLHGKLACGASLIALVAVLVVEALSLWRRGRGWASRALAHVAWTEWRVVVAIGVAPGGGSTLRDTVASEAPDGAVLSNKITHQSAGAGSILQVVGACLIQGHAKGLVGIFPPVAIPRVEEVASLLSRFMHHDEILVHRTRIAIELADRVVRPCNTKNCVRS